MTRLDGAHVIVTGGSEGIGLEVARLAAGSGARVTLIARRPEILDAAADSIAATTGVARSGIVTAPADVTDRAGIDRAIAGAVDRHGPCDVLVCCAGYALPGHFGELPGEEYARHMEVNYLGTVHAILAVTPEMQRRRRGHVLVTSSTAGLIGVFGYAAYAPTKFALRGLAETLRAELVRDGVRIGIIYPPDTQTPGFDRENLTKPAETKAISGAITPISAERMAERVVAGIEKDRFEIFADPSTALLSKVGGLIGPALRPYLDRVARKATGSTR